MIAARDIEAIIGAEAVGPDHDRIGTVSQVFLDEQSAMPTWVSVRLGLFGLSECMVPLEAADWDEQALHVAVSRDVVKHAPHVPQKDELSLNDQARLYQHYGISPHDLLQAPEDLSYSVRSDEPVEWEVTEPTNVSGHMLAR